MWYMIVIFSESGTPGAFTAAEFPSEPSLDEIANLFGCPAGEISKYSLAQCRDQSDAEKQVAEMVSEFSQWLELPS